MTLSTKKEKKSISEKIEKLLQHKEIFEEENDNDLDTGAKFEEFTEHFDIDQKLSEIRKQNIKHLDDLDIKYKGKVVSRRDLENEVDSETSETDVSEVEETANYATDSDDDKSEEDEDDQEQDDFGSLDEGSQEENESEDLEDECDLSQFINKNNDKIEEENVQNLMGKNTLDEDVLKGKAVQNQLKIWESLLDIRIKSQKMLNTVNCFPNYDTYLELSSHEDGIFQEKIDKSLDGIYKLMDNLVELQITLADGFPESKGVLKRKMDNDSNISFMKKSKLANYSDNIGDNYENYSGFCNKTIQKWYDRTKNVRNIKNGSEGNISILTKIENALLNKNELLRRTQTYRGDYDIIGMEEPMELEKDKEIIMPEIYDDSDFYHQLLREIIEYKTNTSENQNEINQKFIELQKLRSKMKKQVDQKASKGRKLRYVVHNKLVNFIAPQDHSEWTNEAKTELFNSLFDKATLNGP